MDEKRVQSVKDMQTEDDNEDDNIEGQMSFEDYP